MIWLVPLRVKVGHQTYHLENFIEFVDRKFLRFQLSNYQSSDPLIIWTVYNWLFYHSILDSKYNFICN